MTYRQNLNRGSPAKATLGTWGSDVNSLGHNTPMQRTIRLAGKNLAGIAYSGYDAHGLRLLLPRDTVGKYISIRGAAQLVYAGNQALDCAVDQFLQFLLLGTFH